MIALVLSVVVFSICFALIYRPERGAEILPPSPFGWLPIVGHLWRLHATKPFETIDQWSKELGDIFSVYFGTERVIVISRDRLLKQAFLKESENFSGRPKLFVHESCWGKGYIISDGPAIFELKKFIMSYLRQKKDINEDINSSLKREVSKMLLNIEKRLQNEQFNADIEEIIFYSVGNVLTDFLVGKTYTHGSKEFKDNCSWLEKTSELMECAAPLTFLPWLRFTPPSGFGFWEMKKQAAAVHDLMRNDVNMRLSTGDYKDENKTDFTSIFLRKIDFERANNISPVFNEEMLVHLMTEFFFAGIQTVCKTFGWAFLYFIEYPDIQEKCRRKILEKFKDKQIIMWSDRSELPYLEATVMEIQRCANVAPFSLFHRNYRATTLDGYYIPPNSTIMTNLYSTMTDHNCFAEPQKFNPDRFLDENGDVISNVRGYYPFGLGIRMCMGENIARSELFVIICALLQRYKFRKISGESYSLEQKLELVIQSKRYELLIERSE